MELGQQCVVLLPFCNRLFTTAYLGLTHPKTFLFRTLQNFRKSLCGVYIDHKEHLKYCHRYGTKLSCCRLGTSTITYIILCGQDSSEEIVKSTLFIVPTRQRCLNCRNIPLSIPEGMTLGLIHLEYKKLLAHISPSGCCTILSLV